ncbi:MAG: hypothetical protein GX180_09440 [Enterococcus sp.]|nr:hypothetical protein [Enterococcus sp.]
MYLNLYYPDKDNQYPEIFTMTNAKEHDRHSFSVKKAFNYQKFELAHQ